MLIWSWSVGLSCAFPVLCYNLVGGVGRPFAARRFGGLLWFVESRSRPCSSFVRPRGLSPRPPRSSLARLGLARRSFGRRPGPRRVGFAAWSSRPPLWPGRSRSRGPARFRRPCPRLSGLPLAAGRSRSPWLARALWRASPSAWAGFRPRPALALGGSRVRAFRRFRRFRRLRGRLCRWSAAWRPLSVLSVLACLRARWRPWRRVGLAPPLSLAGARPPCRPVRPPRLALWPCLGPVLAPSVPCWLRRAPCPPPVWFRWRRLRPAASAWVLVRFCGAAVAGGPAARSLAFRPAGAARRKAAGGVARLFAFVAVAVVRFRPVSRRWR